MIGERRRTLIVRWSESIAAQRRRWAFFIGLLLFQHPRQLLLKLQSAFFVLEIVSDGILGFLKLDRVLAQVLCHPGSFTKCDERKSNLSRMSWASFEAMNPTKSFARFGWAEFFGTPN